MGDFKCDDCYDHTLVARDERCPSCPPNCEYCGREPPASPATVEGFRSTLGSPEWLELVIRARRQFGIEGPEGFYTYDRLHDAMRLALATTRNAVLFVSGEFDPSIDTLWPGTPPSAWYMLFQLRLAAVTLASYLKTRNVDAMLDLLIGFVPPDPEKLQVSAPRTTPLDEFEAEFCKLVAVPPQLRGLDAKDEELVLFLWVMRRKAPARAAPGVYDWDGLRVIWNRSHPKWRYETKESFRKACERALEALKDAADSPPAGPD